MKQPQETEASEKPSLSSNFKNVLDAPRAVYSKQRYNTPLFIFHEVLKAFTRHNVLGLSASLSFYAMFALIPLVLLMFFLLSHLVFSSDYAIVQLAIITGNLVPKFSSDIMVEVYGASKQKAAWGAAGLFVLFWAVTPLAAAMRTSFYNIAALIEAPSFINRKIKDMVAVIGMLILFFLFTFAGMMPRKSVHFIGNQHPWAAISNYFKHRFTIYYHNDDQFILLGFFSDSTDFKTNSHGRHFYCDFMAHHASSI